MVRGRVNLLEVAPRPFRKLRVGKGDGVQPDDGVHGRADLVAHACEKGRLGTAGLLRHRERVSQCLATLAQLLMLLTFTPERLLQLVAILLLLVLDHKAVQHTASQHVPHGVEGQERVGHLQGDECHHGDAKQADGQVAAAHRTMRPRGHAQRVHGGHQKEQDLNRQGDVTRRTGMVGTALVEPEQDGKEMIECHHHDLEAEEQPAHLLEHLAKTTPVL